MATLPHFPPTASPVTAQNSSTNGAENQRQCNASSYCKYSSGCHGCCCRSGPRGREGKVVILQSVLRLTLSTEGGAVVRTELLNYKQDADRSQPVVLLDETPQHSYVAQTGLIGGNYPTHKTVMQLQPGERTLQDGQDDDRAPGVARDGWRETGQNLDLQARRLRCGGAARS